MDMIMSSIKLNSQLKLFYNVGVIFSAIDIVFPIYFPSKLDRFSAVISKLCEINVKGKIYTSLAEPIFHAPEKQISCNI